MAWVHCWRGYIDGVDTLTRADVDTLIDFSCVKGKG